MTADPNHLEIEQIERLLRREIQEDASVPVAQGIEAARRHLAGCEFCQRLLSMEREKDEILRGFRVDAPAAPTPNCPSEAQLYNLAAGLVVEEEEDKLLRHITECAHCAPRLRLATQELETERSAKEDVQIAFLQTSRPEWRRSFAVRIAAAGKLKETGAKARSGAATTRSLTSLWRWLTLATAAVIIVVTPVLYVWQSSPARVHSLLGDAYAQHRTMEFRIPGMRYAALPDATRGQQEESPVGKPIPLLKAEEIIAEGLTQKPSQLDWLQAKIEADLLEGKAVPAIETATTALREHPQLPSLLSELGTAHALQADNEMNDSSANDRATAYELLSRSLSVSPDDSVTLFNRAIVAEKLTLYTQAVEDWEHYLRVETNVQWLAEGRERLKRLRQKMEDRHSLNRRGAVTAEEVASALAEDKAGPASTIESSIDAYQKLLWERWLPALVSNRTVDSRQLDSLLTALRQISQYLRTKHSDAWLVDFLSTRPVEYSSRAITLLTSAVQANNRGEHTAAIALAASAERQFQNEAQEPGRLRAAFEEIYSYRLAARGRPCYDKARRLLEDLRGRSYLWIETQTWLEAGACAAEISRIDESIEDVSKAGALAKSAGYPTLELRSSVFAADLTTDLSKRLDLLIQGLTEFWGGSTEPMRGYSLYAVMDTTADDLRMWFLDEAIIKQGLDLIAADPDLAMRAMEQYRLARAQAILGKDEEAGVNFTKARDLLKTSGSSDLTTSITVDLAETYLLRGQYAEALQLLNQVNQSLPELSHDIIAARFYSARAVTLLATGQAVDAMDTLNLSRKLASKGIETISSERDRFEWIHSFLPTYKSLARVKFETDPETSFQVWESFRGASLSPPPMRDDYEVAESELPRFDSWQSNGTVLVSYAAFPDGVGVWVYDGVAVRGEFIRTSMPEIETLLREFSTNCHQPSHELSPVIAQGKELYDLLVRPIGSFMHGKRRLIVEMDDAFGIVPFEAFVNTEGKYLSEVFDVEYTPGLFYLAAKRRNGTVGRQSRALIVGLSRADGQSDLPFLPDALDEARAIAHLFDRPQLLLDDQAILKNVRTFLPRAEVFHFAGHAIESKHRNVLILKGSTDDSESRFFGVSNFSGYALRNAQLVVLSACSTAGGSAPTINDRDSLVRNALASGVPNVVASRWRVDSEAARAWMDVFYVEILNGKTASEAARKASIGLRANPSWKYPYYWASFAVFV